ncbi:MAG: YitT family protein [Lachnospiraceae bacterium]|nr:YitT family protein [Lachnospiraceae bacterium]MBQ8633901.1 YitT family protein [Lachnospiraceae bacterium]
MRKQDLGLWKDIVYILAGTFLMSLGINFAFDPMGLVCGGVTGLAIVVKYLTGLIWEGGIPVWLSNLLFNGPLFIVALIKKGKKYIAKTVFATVMLSVWIYIIPIYQLFDDYVLATLFGGVMTGAGIGMVLARMATTGGTDLLSALIHDKLKHLTIPQLLAVTDGAIVVLGAVVFGVENAMYAICVVYICAKISDGMLEGLKFAKMAHIISDKAEEIAEIILTDVDRGATGVKVQGMYSKEEKKMLICVVTKKEIVELIDIVHKIDPSAFVIVNDVHEVRGEGFIEITQ